MPKPVSVLKTKYKVAKFVQKSLYQTFRGDSNWKQLYRKINSINNAGRIKKCLLPVVTIYTPTTTERDASESLDAENKNIFINMGPVAKQRISNIWGIFRHVFRWGWIPFIISLGMGHGADPGMPPPTYLGLFWG